MSQVGEKRLEENPWRSSEETWCKINVEPRRSLECTELRTEISPKEKNMALQTRS